jgi:hypothetical protein
MSMDSTYKPSLSERINIRMIVFFSVLALIIGYPIYIYIDSAVHQGIKDVGGGYKEVDLKAMSVFPFDQVNGTIDDIPIKWRQLDGTKVIANGEMWQAQSAARYVDSFDLVYSISKCCFNGPPQIQHFVHARASKGAELEYIEGLVRVKGTLHVKVTREADKVSGVYWMDVDTVEQDVVNIPWVQILGFLIGIPLVLWIIRKLIGLRRPSPAAA